MGASLLSYEGSIFKAGATAYLRLRVIGFAEDFDGVKCAVCESIGKDGQPDTAPGVRAQYQVPEAQLVPGRVVAEEMNPGPKP